MCNVLNFIQLINPIYSQFLHLYTFILFYFSGSSTNNGGYSDWGSPSVDALGVRVILLFIIYM